MSPYCHWFFFFFSSRRRHTRFDCDWSSDVCSSDLVELQKGSSAVEKAEVAGARTQRERDYIAAIKVFYQDADKLDHRTRTFAYNNAMEIGRASCRERV